VSELLGTVINWSSERALLEEMRQMMEMSISSEKEILKVLKVLQEIGTESDTEDTLLEKINNIFKVAPEFFGVGVDVNEIIRIFIKRKKRSSLKSVVANII
jgi:internalin A